MQISKHRPCPYTPTGEDLQFPHCLLQDVNWWNIQHMVKQSEAWLTGNRCNQSDFLSSNYLHSIVHQTPKQRAILVSISLCEPIAVWIVWCVCVGRRHLWTNTACKSAEHWHQQYTKHTDRGWDESDGPEGGEDDQGAGRLMLKRANAALIRAALTIFNGGWMRFL